MPGGGRPQLRLRGAERDVAFVEDFAERHGGLGAIVRALRRSPTAPARAPIPIALLLDNALLERRVKELERRCAYLEELLDD